MNINEYVAIIVSGDYQVTLNLTKSVYKIGRDTRDSDCDIRIPDSLRRVSRSHARLVLRVPDNFTETPYYIIQDIGSQNGTWVHDNKIENFHQLRDGDEIKFGGCKDCPTLRFLINPNKCHDKDSTLNSERN